MCMSAFSNKADFLEDAPRVEDATVLSSNMHHETCAGACEKTARPPEQKRLLFATIVLVDVPGACERFN